MSKKLNTVWPMEPHTEAKHKILTAYYGAWLSIVGQRFPRTVFVDGFAGPGRYSGGEPGSPITVLQEAEKVLTRKTQSLHSSLRAEHWFIEENPARKQHLDGEVSAVSYSDPRLVIHSPLLGSFEQHIRTILMTLPPSTVVPLLVFIDPFGAKGFSMGILEQILRRDSAEVFLLFDVDGIDRLLMAWDQPGNAAAVTSIFGVPESELRAIKDTPGDQKTRIPMLRELFSSSLKRRDIARRLLPFQMLNQSGVVLYDLVFLTNNDKGFVKMKEAMWKADSTGDFRFSDAEAEQSGLPLDFLPEDRLWLKLVGEFGGRTVSGDAVNVFVDLQTRFLQPHKTEALRKHEEDGLFTGQQITVTGRKSKGARGYPPHVQIQFPAVAT